MADVIPDEGQRNLMKLAFKLSVPIFVHLFKNDVTPELSTVIGDLTEANYSGYAAINLDTLPDPITVISGKARLQIGDLSFSHNGGIVGNTVYGYHVVAHDGSDRLFLWANRMDDGPQPMNVLGDEIVIEMAVSEVQEV